MILRKNVRTDLSIFSALELVLLTAMPMAVGAHSIKDKGELDNLMGEKEKYFQPLDQEAPDFTLQDADGKTVELRDFQDKVVVLHFIYTNCPDVCPLHAERIAEIQAMVNRTPMRDLVQFVTITTDPKNDTPEVIREYGPARGLDPVNWTFLTSGPNRLTATRKLVEQFGHKFTKEGDGYQVHNVVTHVIDREGRWRANFHALKFQPANLVLFINALVNDTNNSRDHSQRSFWDRVQELF